MHRRWVAVAVMIAGLPLCGCGSINTKLTETIGEHLPAWAGGLPEDAPPRPGDPRYAAFERAQNERRGITPQEVSAPGAVTGQAVRAGETLAPTRYRLDGKALY